MDKYKDSPFACRETVRDNLSLVTEDVLGNINVAIVNAGHQGWVRQAFRCWQVVIPASRYETKAHFLNLRFVQFRHLC